MYSSLTKGKAVIVVYNGRFERNIIAELLYLTNQDFASCCCHIGFPHEFKLQEQAFRISLILALDNLCAGHGNCFSDYFRDFYFLAIHGSFVLSKLAEASQTLSPLLSFHLCPFSSSDCSCWPISSTRQCLQVLTGLETMTASYVLQAKVWL